MASLYQIIKITPITPVHIAITSFVQHVLSHFYSIKNITEVNKGKMVTWIHKFNMILISLVVLLDREALVWQICVGKTDTMCIAVIATKKMF